MSDDPNAYQNEQAQNLMAAQLAEDERLRTVKITEAIQYVSDEVRKRMIEKALRTVDSKLTVH